MRKSSGCMRRLTVGAVAVGLVAMSAAQAFATGSYSNVIAPTRGTTNGVGPGYVAPGPISTTLSANDTITLTGGGVLVEIETHLVWDTGTPGLELGTAQWKINGLTTAGCPACGLAGLGFANGIGAQLEPLGFTAVQFPNGGYINAARCLFSDREGGAANGFDPPCSAADPADGPAVEVPEFAMSGQVPAPTAQVAFPDINYEYLLVSNAGGGNSGGAGGDGSRFYGGTLRLDIPAGAAGTYEIGLLQDPLVTFLSDKDVVTIADGSATFPFDALNPAFIVIETGRCCFGLGGGGAGCAENQTAGTCNDVAFPGPVVFQVNQVCPPAGPDCPSCLIDSECDDGDACTADTCVANVCFNDEAPIFNSNTTCCDPATGAQSTPSTLNDCELATCTITGLGAQEAGNGRGSATVANQPAGTACNDGSACKINDECDGAGLCEGSDVNLVACPNGIGDCPVEAQDCVGGQCVCSEDTPLCVEYDAGSLPDGNCYEDGEAVRARIAIGAGSEKVAGGQFLLNYDPTCLNFVDADDCGGIYTNVITMEVDEVAGVIFLAVASTQQAQGDPVLFEQGPADIFCLNFTKSSDCAACDICLTDSNPRNTILSNINGNRVGLDSCGCSKEIRRNGGVTLDTPAGDSVNADCDQTTGTVTWNMASASDECEGDITPSIVCQEQHDGGAAIGHLTATGGSHPQGTSFYTCTATNSCGDSATNVWTVSVSSQTTVDVEVHYGCGPDTLFERAITFDIYTDCSSTPDTQCTEMQFGDPFNFSRHATASLKVDKGNFSCITAKDGLHTLRAVAAPSCTAGGSWFAKWKGDPLQGGNWLVCGNHDCWKSGISASDANAINILDFIMLMDEVANSASYPPRGDTTCTTTGPHGDVNADGSVDSGDFAIVVDNFLDTSKNLCCPDATAGVVGNDAPRTSVTVKELRAMGLGNMVGADLNSDGTVDMDDMALYMQGVDPISAIDRKGVKDRSSRSR